MSESTKKLVRDTKYATELAIGVASLGTEGEGRIERLLVKEKQEEAIRFSWWNNGMLIPRPLDLTEKQLLDLFKDAINTQVFSTTFRSNLKELL